jgi:hypothetical protein
MAGARAEQAQVALGKKSAAAFMRVDKPFLAFANGRSATEGGSLSGRECLC